MGFLRGRLRQLRRSAGLDPLPPFYVEGARLPTEDNAAYIDARYFAPAALRWADEVIGHIAQGTVNPIADEDAECLKRVWSASRQGRAPTAAQRRDYEKDRKWLDAEARIPELFALEMRSRGIKEYGPDYELPDDVKEPGSGEELIYRYLYEELGYKNPQSAKANHKAWRAQRVPVGTP